MSNTKQPPAELVEKMKEIMGKTVPYENAVNLRAESLAQIAVQHAEPFKEQFIKWLNLYNQKEEENRELREFLSEFVQSCEGGMPHDRDLKEQAKQLLNKNEDGKE